MLTLQIPPVSITNVLVCRLQMFRRGLHGCPGLPRSGW